MNFPTELVHASGALPTIIQEDRAPITAGRAMLYEFYCAYTRSISDQAVTEKLDFVDGFFFVDHCISLIGAVDAMRYALPDKPMFLAQFIASMDEPWSEPVVRSKLESLLAQLRDFTGAAISDEDLANSIRACNRNRRLLRKLYALRRTGRTQLTSRQMQALVKSSMVMDIDEHSELLEGLMDAVQAEAEDAPQLVRLHLSGHFCHAPKPESARRHRGVRGDRGRRRPLHGLPAHLDRRRRDRRPGRRAGALVHGPQRDRPVRDPRPERRRLGRLSPALARARAGRPAWSC